MSVAAGLPLQSVYIRTRGLGCKVAAQDSRSHAATMNSLSAVSRQTDARRRRLVLLCRILWHHIMVDFGTLW